MHDLLVGFLLFVAGMVIGDLLRVMGDKKVRTLGSTQWEQNDLLRYTGPRKLLKLKRKLGDDKRKPNARDNGKNV